MADRLFDRLSKVAVLPDFRAALFDLVKRDWSRESPAIKEQGSLQRAFETVFETLGGGERKMLEPFLVAWYTMRATVLRLDHLQDADRELVDDFITDAPHAHHYNLILGSYLLALAMLDEIDTELIPQARILRLRRLWNDSLLEAASGQQRDLTARSSDANPRQVLDVYEETIRAKAGSIYRIGFGGVAMLATDDQPTIDVFCRLGEVFGTLLQLNDDLLDAGTETEPALTLSQAYRSTCGASGIPLPAHDIHMYAHHVYRSYLEYIHSLVMTLPCATQHTLLLLFRQAFGLSDESSGAT